MEKPQQAQREENQTSGNALWLSVLTQGLIRGGGGGGGVDWVASHPPWVCNVHKTNSLFEHSLINLNKPFL